jgi:hypothetical protein
LLSGIAVGSASLVGSVVLELGSIGKAFGQLELILRD